MLHSDQSYWVAQYYSYCVAQSRSRTEDSVKQTRLAKGPHRSLIARGAALIMALFRQDRPYLR